MRGETRVGEIEKRGKRGVSEREERERGVKVWVTLKILAGTPHVYAAIRNLNILDDIAITNATSLVLLHHCSSRE